MKLGFCCFCLCIAPWERMRRGGSFFLNYIKKTLTPLANHLKQSSTLLAILPTMEKYKESLEKFIYNIQNRTISENEVIVGELNSQVISFLESKSITVTTKYIYLSVRAYKHILRDFKKKLGKAVPNEVVNDMYKTLYSPYKIFFDTQKKHCNLIYVDTNNKLLFKIVIQPNYTSKLGTINSIITAGIIDKSSLNDKYYEEITEHGWESNPR